VSPLDGYYSVDWRNNILDSDRALQTFFSSCAAAGLIKCSFSKDGNTTLSPRGIHKRLDKLLERIAYHPPPISFPNSTSESARTGEAPRLFYPLLMNILFGATYEPKNYFFLISEALTALDVSNDTSLLAPYLVSGQDDGHGTAIFCTDGSEEHDSVKELEAFAASSRKISEYFATSGAGIQRAACSGWQIHPDNFRGPITGNTSFPILLIGNIIDPITPLAMAHKASSAFPGSRVLSYNITGHTSLFLPSSCIRDHVRAYFGEGKLPDEGVMCETDEVVDYFSRSRTEDVI
jgi:hypothetical protein